MGSATTPHGNKTTPSTIVWKLWRTPFVRKPFKSKNTNPRCSLLSNICCYHSAHTIKANGVLNVYPSQFSCSAHAVSIRMLFMPLRPTWNETTPKPATWCRDGNVPLQGFWTQFVKNRCLHLGIHRCFLMLPTVACKFRWHLLLSVSIHAPSLTLSPLGGSTPKKYIYICIYIYILQTNPMYSYFWWCKS